MKSILTRDQDLYDKQSLQLQAHQTHFERQTKAKDFGPLCLLLKTYSKSAHAFSNLCHSSFIDAFFF